MTKMNWLKSGGFNRSVMLSHVPAFGKTSCLNPWLNFALPGTNSDQTWLLLLILDTYERF